jgi:hypothetical protein
MGGATAGTPWVALQILFHEKSLVPLWAVFQYAKYFVSQGQIEILRLKIIGFKMNEVGAPHLAFPLHMFQEMASQPALAMGFFDKEHIDINDIPCIHARINASYDLISGFDVIA